MRLALVLGLAFGLATAGCASCEAGAQDATDDAGDGDGATVTLPEMSNGESGAQWDLVDQATDPGTGDEPDTIQQYDDAGSAVQPETKELPAECPVASFKVMVGGQEITAGQNVLPQTVLQLADNSHDPSGSTIDKWQWDVVQPVGCATFSPSPMFQNPTLEADVAGNYMFRLTVWEDTGVQSCTTAEKTVTVQPEDGCHLELLWDTPADPDQCDTCPGSEDCGTDMDLHVLCQSEDPWIFFGQGDTNPFNADPICEYDLQTSEPLDAAHQPHLTRDDEDGTGPGIFTFEIPPADKCYKVGVHYWDDHGFGPSYPTIRVFIDGQMKFKWDQNSNPKAPKMVKLDLWEAGDLCFGNKENPFTMYLKDSQPVVIPQYMSP